MSARREPSPPPTLPGFQYTRLLGMGGFADVFLYQQAMPRRAVAVKVMLASHLSYDALERFRTEADLMARLSHHPSIVTIHQADVATDGRPFLVMEYCSRGGLGQQYRVGRMPVAEVLRIGIRLASAVETAHRAGILHRDIKPANVLVTDFGWPALTDFGIASTAAEGATGMSIPWSPPEMIAEHPTGDERSDIYSLAATVYSLLARRSPFEVPDGPNSAADIVSRIERAPLAPTGRGDVPAELQAVLERALAKSPAARPGSALEFARALQQVETAMLLPPTPLDLPEEAGTAVVGPAIGEADQATRLRPLQTVTPEGAPAPPVAPVPEPPAPRRPRSADRSPRGRRIGVVAGLVVALALGGAAWGALRPGAPEPPPVTTPAPTTTAPVAVAVPTPTDLTATTSGDLATFTWTNPDPAEGDRYLWGVATLTGTARLEQVDDPRVTVPATTDGVPTCLEVSIVRADGRYSTTPATGCAP